MRKILAGLMLCLCLFSMFTTSSDAKAYVYWKTSEPNVSDIPVKVRINSVRCETQDIEPVMHENRVFVPASFVHKYISNTMSFEENNQIVNFENDRLIVDTITGEISSYGVLETNYYQPYIRNNSIMIPIRTVALAFNYKVRWNDYTREVELYRK